MNPGPVILQASQVVEQIELLFVSQHQPDARQHCHRLGLKLGVAARHHDRRPAVLGHRPSDELAGRPVGLARYAAGVDHVDVGLGLEGDHLQEAPPAGLPHDVGLHLVKLAA